jgi:hypothetical protein
MSKREISGAWVVMLIGLLLPVSFASAKEAKMARKAPTVLVEVEGKLLTFQEEHTECTYQPGAEIHGMFESPPQARFVIISPKIYSGHAFDVVFKCDVRKGVLAAMESGRDRVFRLALPSDFLRNFDSRIEDCTIGKKGMARWRLQEQDERVKKASLPASAAEVGSGTGAVVCRMPLGCVRRFRLRARLEVPSLRLRPPPHRTGQADFPHPAHREGVFHRGYASVQLGHAFALQYTTR